MMVTQTCPALPVILEDESPPTAPKGEKEWKEKSACTPKPNNMYIYIYIYISPKKMSI
jgi:hypothetical protein